MHRRFAVFAYQLVCRCPLSTQTAASFHSLRKVEAAQLLSHPRPLACFWARRFSSLDVTKEVDLVNQLFAEARDEIEFAKEEAETVYFDESVRAARKAVEACMARWEGLLAALPEDERNRVVRTMGLKIAQLQAEFDEVSKLHLED